ncbi:MAG: diacylglycerol kinase family lipid kinase [Bryobacterales bacterium]|nr:diacylglycerol kinase family lipid kinase [Bryobacterales bacterium]
MVRPLVAILNPQAAGGKTVRRWPAFAQAIEQRLGALETLETERPGHAGELARQAIEAGAETIVAVGGDGTLNEVVNGFFSGDKPVREGARLAYVPMGTGGDFQRTVQLPSDPAGVAAALAGGKTWAIDVAKIRLVSHDGAPLERYFVNLASFGMGGDVSIRAKNCWLTRHDGKLAFLWATFAVFLAYTGKTVRLRLDDEAEERVFTVTNVALGNGRYHGGGMQPCPLAKLDDGLLEVTTIERLSWFELIRDLRILYSDNVYVHPKTRRFQVKRMRAEADEITRIEVDGEALGRLPLEAWVLPGALELIVP